MKSLPRLAIGATLLAGLLQPALATTFDFSFDWYGNAGGPELVGSFEATDRGTYVDDITNLSASLNGTPYVGPLTIFNYTDHQLANTPKVYFDIASNNFFFTNNCTGSLGSYTCSPQTNGFLLRQPLPWPDQVANAWTPAWRIGDEHTTSPPSELGVWSLTARPVPEPSSYALLAGGLTLLGLASRRRSRKS